MEDVIIIVGLPGSGKTELANREYVSKGYFHLEDPSTWLTLKEVKETLKNSTKPCVITDAVLCYDGFRDKLIEIFEELDLDRKWIFFENDPTSAMENQISRGDNPERITNVWAMSQGYTIPPVSQRCNPPLPVWKG